MGGKGVSALRGEQLGPPGRGGRQRADCRVPETGRGLAQTPSAHAPPSPPSPAGPLLWAGGPIQPARHARSTPPTTPGCDRRAGTGAPCQRGQRRRPWFGLVPLGSCGLAAGCVGGGRGLIAGRSLGSRLAQTPLAHALGCPLGRRTVAASSTTYFLRRTLARSLSESLLWYPTEESRNFRSSLVLKWLTFECWSRPVPTC